MLSFITRQSIAFAGAFRHSPSLQLSSMVYASHWHYQQSNTHRDSSLHRSRSRARLIIAAAQKWYAVRKGRRTGLYTTWAEAEKQVMGYSSAEFKSFNSRQEAEAYLNLCGDDARADVQQSTATSSRRQTSEPSKTKLRIPAVTQDASHVEYKLATRTQRIDPNLQYTVEFDGGSRGNPGPAGFGAVLRQPDGTVVQATAGFLVSASTNNEAEYWAALTGLVAAQKVGVTKIQLVGDSQLVVQQLTGAYKVNKPHLKKLYDRVMKAQSTLAASSVRHVRREYNRAADQLGNMAMDVLMQTDSMHEQDEEEEEEGARLPPSLLQRVRQSLLRKVAQVGPQPGVPVVCVSIPLAQPAAAAAAAAAADNSSDGADSNGGIDSDNGGNGRMNTSRRSSDSSSGSGTALAAIIARKAGDKS